MSKGPNSDPDDYFADTRMSFGDHIEELRHHLWKAIYGFLFALFFAFFIGKYVMDFITAPVKAQLVRFYDKRMDRVLSEKRDQLVRLNQPSPYRKVYFLRDQLQAIVGGKDLDPRRPVIQTPEREEREKNPPLWWQKLLLGAVDPLKTPPVMEDYHGDIRKIPEEDKERSIVGVWMSIDNPLFFSSDTVGPIREILQIDSPTTLRA